MHGILHDKYYIIANSEKYLIQKRSPAKSSGIKLPEVHGVSRGLDPNIQPEKQAMKSLVSKVNIISQIKPRIGQGRAGLRCKKPQISQPIAQSVKQKIPEVPKYRRKS